MQDTIKNAVSLPDSLNKAYRNDSSNIVTVTPVFSTKEKKVSPKRFPSDSISTHLNSSDNLKIIGKTDSIQQLPFIKEIKVPSRDWYSDSFFSRNINTDHLGDWYFILIIGILVLVAWIRMVYYKYLIRLFESSYNFHLASKIYNERGIIHKRIGYIFDLIYLVNGALFLLLIFRFFRWNFLKINDFEIFSASFAFLFTLIFIRNAIMRFIGHFFNRNSLFSEFLYHFYIYTKIIGIVLLPFVLAISYTGDPLNKILIYSALSVIAILYLLRLIRVVLFTIKNVLLLFYLILYLCTLEILPLFVIIKLIISLT
jgi:hypothetical protein